MSLFCLVSPHLSSRSLDAAVWLVLLLRLWLLMDVVRRELLLLLNDCQGWLVYLPGYVAGCGARQGCCAGGFDDAASRQ